MLSESSPLMPACKSKGVACTASASRLCHAQGLCLDLKNLRMSPNLLARLAHSVAGKQDVRKVVGQLLPDLCQVRTPSCSLANLPCLTLFTGHVVARSRERPWRPDAFSSHTCKPNSKCRAVRR